MPRRCGVHGDAFRHAFIVRLFNSVERALREHVVIRKIIDTLRNEKGTSIHETIMTMFATWKQQGLNLFTELKDRLS